MNTPADTNTPTLGIPGFTWRALRDPARLAVLTDRFHTFASQRASAEAWSLFRRYRDGQGEGLAPEQVSEALVHIAPLLGAFVAILFGIDEDRARVIELAEREAVIFAFKREFVHKRAARRRTVDIDALDREARRGLDADARAALAVSSGIEDDVWNDEREVAQAVMLLVGREDLFRRSITADGPQSTDADRQDAAIFARKLAVRERLAPMLAAAGVAVTDTTTSVTDADAARIYGVALALLDLWCALRVHDTAYDPRWVSLREPAALDYQHLVQVRRPDARLPDLLAGLDERLRARDGFALTDPRPTARENFDSADYCVYCHERNEDSCSKGLLDKATGKPRSSPLGVALEGCPLEQKISEANYLKKCGASIAALAVVMVDNPMCPGTGHRICNDCMKSCIYQEQEPVDAPAIETSILTDVLGARWGFEVYDLLTRWNPLNVRRPHALPYNGKNILVVGLGPAGYTLAHHLLNEGFGVVGVDSLKIEPLGAKHLDAPIEHWRDLCESLDERIALGFGGVSEYGIPARWDKNFLGVVYATLARRANFRAYGGVRLGSTLDVDDAWSLGFDHIAMASGAGHPTTIDMPGGLARGIRQASDFLMALQLAGARKKSSLASLPLRLPGLVIGGGLTGIDAATEMRAYYGVQCEKALERFDVLAGEIGAENVLRMYDAEEREIFDEALAHGRAIRAEREAAASEGRAPDFNRMIDAWGGVTIAYRRSLIDSPAYRRNHREVQKCLEEGVRFLEHALPKEALIDEHGAVRAVLFDRVTSTDGKLVPTGETVEIPARSVCIAAGTSPGGAYERELSGTFELDPTTGAYRAHNAAMADDGTLTLAPDPAGCFTSYSRENRAVTFHGDSHPAYAGSVPNAMASAKKGSPVVVALFAPHLKTLSADDQPARDAAWRAFASALDDALVARVVEVKRLASAIIEVIVRAPLAARRFRPGQLFVFQNFETTAPVIAGTRLAMSGLALAGASIDPEAGLVSTVVQESSASARLCAVLTPGEPVVLVGPAGLPTEIPAGQNVILTGGGPGNAALLSTGRALRASGCKVLYFAAFRRPEDIYKTDVIEAAADQVIWSVDQGATPATRRPQDRATTGNVVQAMTRYAKGEFGEPLFDLASCDRIIANGSEGMIAAVRDARAAVLEPYLKPDHVFAWAFHDQELDGMNVVPDRRGQASPYQKLANLWLSRLLKFENVLRV